MQSSGEIHRDGRQFVATFRQYRGRRRTLTELASHSVICYAVKEGVIPLIATRGNHRERVTLNARLRTNDLQFTRDAACAGAGIGILARYAVDRTMDDGQLIELLPEYSFSLNSSKLYVQTLQSRYQTPLARILANRFRERLQELQLSRRNFETRAVA